jgi:hypothetical protein
MKTRLFLVVAAVVCLMMALPAPAAISSDSPKEEIVVTSALFGSGTKVADVTKRVAELLRSESAGFAARGDWLRADPLPYKSKALVIVYIYKGRHCLFLVSGGGKVSYDLLVENAER